MQIKKVVLTGGPCGGKSTTIKAIQVEFGDKVVVVPEAATILLSGGFPTPGGNLPWSEEWQANFQATILTLQKSLEQIHEQIAKNIGATLLVCDRGIMDGAAYTPGGPSEFTATHNIVEDETVARYEAVIHLESLATARPELYGKGNNEHRMESLEEAQALEAKTRKAWASHPKHMVIDGTKGINKTITKVVAEVKQFLAS